MSRGAEYGLAAAIALGIGAVIAAACGHAPAAQLPVCPAPAPAPAGATGAATPTAISETVAGPTGPAAAAAPELDDAKVIAMSHAWFDAMDRMDVDAFRAPLAPSFVLFESARFVTADMMAKGMQARRERGAPARTRTWTDDHVYRGPDSAVFIGESIEHLPVDGDHPATEFDGWSTLVWVRAGATWQLAHYQWAIGGIEAERQMWNDNFRAETGFKLTANQTLIDAVKGVKPGTALDIATGQGRNAVYLATQKWKVTGVDISDVGLAIANANAAKQKVKITTIESEIEKYDLGKAKWDLVTMIYAGADLPLVERIKPALKKGGLFVTEYFAVDSDAAKSGAGGWDDATLTAAFKDGFEILRNDVVEDVADYSLRKQKLVRFVARKK